MASQDPNPQGGSITDMAVEGTKIPNDAGIQNTIPSVPRPDQITDTSNDPNNLGATDLAGAADNAQDISRVCDRFLPAFQTHPYLTPLTMIIQRCLLTPPCATADHTRYCP